MRQNQAASSTFGRDARLRYAVPAPHKSATNVFCPRGWRGVYKRVDPGRPQWKSRTGWCGGCSGSDCRRANVSKLIPPWAVNFPGHGRLDGGAQAKRPERGQWALGLSLGALQYRGTTYGAAVQTLHPTDQA